MTNREPRHGWAQVTGHGYIYTHQQRLLEPEEWTYIIAHQLLHLGFGHFQGFHGRRALEWNIACDCIIARFLADLRFGTPPLPLIGLTSELATLPDYRTRTEELLYEDLCEKGIPSRLMESGTAGDEPDMLLVAEKALLQGQPIDWLALLNQGLTEAVREAVDLAGMTQNASGEVRRQGRPDTPAERARSWFVNHYPLLGALAASFEIVEDSLLCQRLDIRVAAIDCAERVLYLNPVSGLNAMPEEMRFVIAHELLHAGLRHDVRRQGRDAFLWNVACDYVINDWLIEMGIGSIPNIGLLHDPQLRGMSAEEIYTLIVTDMRRFRRLGTFRGDGLGDMLEPRHSEWWANGSGVDLDEFYRRSLSQGLEYHQMQQRGFLPAGLIEEIRALDQPPIPWDVRLARWFDNHFPPIEKVRTYARASRRQSATPEIPRPLWVPPPPNVMGRTYGVLLDTSGSMDTKLLAKALGTIASYSIARDVPAVRVVFCDAATYDQGYLPPEDIARSVKIRGRGGTILQPGIDLLEQAKDFPKDGPLLIITDGYCDVLHIHREHAYLLPESRFLPFLPKGPVFHIK